MPLPPMNYSAGWPSKHRTLSSVQSCTADNEAWSISEYQEGGGGGILNIMLFLLWSPIRSVLYRRFHCNRKHWKRNFPACPSDRILSDKLPGYLCIIWYIPLLGKIIEKLRLNLYLFWHQLLWGSLEGGAPGGKLRSACAVWGGNFPPRLILVY